MRDKIDSDKTVWSRAPKSRLPLVGDSWTKRDTSVGPECGKECGLCDSHEVLYVHHGWRAEMMMEGSARRF